MSKVLGIESTAHTLGIGIYDSESNRILSNVFDTHVSNGFIPRELVEHHQRVFADVLREALKKAKLNMKDIDLIGVAQGPGIGAPLKFGVSMANYLADRYKKKIVGVNHGFSHIKITELMEKVDPEDCVVIYISGGNTQILYSKDGYNYEVLGETLDIGIGNLFDNFARILNLYPANGASLEKYGKKRYVDLPYSIKGMNLTFSGLLTSAKNKVKGASEEERKRIAYSLMHNAFAMVLESAERAFHLKKAKVFLACGGAAQSKQFKKMIKKLAEENEAKVAITKDEYNRDNGAMIAYASYLVEKKYGAKKRIKAIQNYRVEDLEKVVKNKDF